MIDAIGDRVLGPSSLTPEQEDLCSRLEDLYKNSDRPENPSRMFRGAVYAMRLENRSNPDWMAQAAHSLREILYQFTKKGKAKKGTKGKAATRREAFKRYGSVIAAEDRFDEEIGIVNNRITEVAHHTTEITEIEFERLFSEYQRVLRSALTRQTDIHSEIDRFFSEDLRQ